MQKPGTISECLFEAFQKNFAKEYPAELSKGEFCWVIRTLSLCRNDRQDQSRQFHVNLIRAILHHY